MHAVSLKQEFSFFFLFYFISIRKIIKKVQWHNLGTHEVYKRNTQPKKERRSRKS
jgi:hypothetical protein